jgi:hypothetical protein
MKQVVIPVIVVIMLIIVFFCGCENNNEDDAHDHFNALEPWWIPIGASPNYNNEEHSFQSIVLGDLFGNESLVALTHYHNEACDVYLNTT